MKRISNKIDLTENGEFSGGTMNRLFNLMSGEIFDIAYKETENRRSKHERIFGRKYHYTDVMEAVDCDMFALEEAKWRCPRCGRKLFPWDDIYGLCKACRKDMETPPSNRAEYKWLYYRSFTGKTTDDRDILRLR